MRADTAQMKPKAAQIAMMEDEFVRKRHWITE
jgi:hypothetical protein